MEVTVWHMSQHNLSMFTNLQVAIGGQNVLQSNLFYNYENFLDQVNLAEQLTSSDFGVSTGLISQGIRLIEVSEF